MPFEAERWPVRVKIRQCGNIRRVRIVHDGGGVAVLAQSQPSLFSDGIFVFRCRENRWQKRLKPFTNAPNAAALPRNGRANARIAASGTRKEKRPLPILGGGSSTVQSLSSVTATEVPRNPTGMGELDRVLGGGLVDGAVILLGGDPGIGKSTLLLQTIAKMAQSRKVLYVSGEESAQQVALRAQRLELPTEGVNLLAEIRMEAIQAALKQHQPEVVVIDSIQTMYSDQITSAPGSVSQVRECAAQLTRMAKQMGIAMILVGHVTKDGAIAGPRVLEHMVDTVLYFEGDQHSNYRMIRAIKNRFGAANELGVFAMTENGLKGVSNPSAIFLASYRDDTPGSCVLVTQEGSRPLLVEIQALVDDAHGFTPKRLTVGLEQNRLAMLLAVLNRHGGIACFDQDVFLNAVGGVKIGEPAADLAVILAMLSSFRSLSGEVRPARADKSGSKKRKNSASNPSSPKPICRATPKSFRT
ncbi:DNA repair protein RadA [Neisseria meningitidis NM151]|nr:DNA repair protein RadA [Neisseria meningitidis NM151]